MGWHSYYVKYIARSGYVARRLVMASSSAEAKRKASDDGCDDVLGARRAKFFSRNLLKLLVIIISIAVLLCFLL